MNKKILLSILGVISISIIVVMLVMFMGGKDKKNTGEIIAENVQNKVEKESSSEEEKNEGDLIYEDTYKFWGIKELKAPEMESLTWEKKEIAKNTYINIATTPFEYDIEKIYKNLKNNSYMNEMYKTIVKSEHEVNEGEFYTDVGHQIGYKFTQSLQADLKTTEERKLSSVSDFKVTISKDKTNYANVSGIKMTLENLNPDMINQKEILGIVEIVFGEKAEYMVYGKDSDRKKYDSKVNGSAGKKDLSELIKLEECSYYIVRNIEENRTNKENINIEFSIGIAENPKKNYFTTKAFGEEHTSIYKTMPYKIEELVSERFGNCDILEFSSFGDKYFKSQYNTYTRTDMQPCFLSEYETEDGRTGILINVSYLGICSDIPKYQSPKININIYLEENNGKITDLNVWITGENSIFEEGKKEKQEFVDAVSKMIKCIYDDFDLSGITCVENRKDYRCECDISTNIKGEKVYGKLSINPASSKFTIDMTLNGALI